ncbi:hypothetical protein LINPERHAP1_LOCUS10485, partial [Linum perenne]
PEQDFSEPQLQCITTQKRKPRIGFTICDKPTIITDTKALKKGWLRLSAHYSFEDPCCSWLIKLYLYPISTSHAETDVNSQATPVQPFSIH